MASVLRLSEASSLALHSMALLAAIPDRLVSVKEIASLIHVSEAHLSKVLQRLAKAGFVKSIRGPKGGFNLGVKAEEIALIDVFEAIEGPLNADVCLLGNPICDGKKCILGNLLKDVNKEFREHLSKTKLSEFACLYQGFVKDKG